MRKRKKMIFAITPDATAADRTETLTFPEKNMIICKYIYTLLPYIKYDNSAYKFSPVTNFTYAEYQVTIIEYTGTYKN